MDPGNLVPVSYILSVLDYTYTLYTILYSIATTMSLEQVMREDKVNYLIV